MTLKELYERIQTKKSIEVKLNDIYLQKEELEERVDLLKTQWLKEQKDVERLEKSGLSSFIYDLVGNRSKKMDKEQAEAYEAKVKYDQATYQLTLLQNDILHYENQLESLQQDEKYYEELFQQKKDELKDYPEIITLEEKISQKSLNKKEIEEALVVGNHCIAITNNILQNIDNASAYATWDILGGGLLADMAKYEALDHAQENIRQLQIHLSRFKTELSDVNIYSDVTITIDGFTRVADYFFDNIFTDFTVKKHIEQSQQQMNDVHTKVKTVVDRLNELLKEENKELESLNQRLKEIIIQS